MLSSPAPPIRRSDPPLDLWDQESLSQAGRNVFLWNTGDGTDTVTNYSYTKPDIVNDILSLGQVTYASLALTGAGTADIALAASKKVLGPSMYHIGDTKLEFIQYLQVIVSPTDYSAASTDALRNHKVALIDYQAVAQDAAS